MSRDILDLEPPVPDQRLSYGELPQQFGDLRLPAGPGPHPVVAAIHGGYWRAQIDLTYYGHLCAALTTLGYATWNIEYRRVGHAGGGWPGTFLDVAAGVDHLGALATRFPLDLDRVVLVGHSAGGHLALWNAARRKMPAGDPLGSANPLPLRGVVSLAGLTDLRRGYEQSLGGAIIERLLGGTPTEQPERYVAASPIELLPLGVRQVLLHGTADLNVPIEQSTAYAARARTAGDQVELFELPGADHFVIVDPRTADWQAVPRAIGAVLA
ncbi:MAG: alpha/beta hydrolase [Chloroflexota bacterium]